MPGIALTFAAFIVLLAAFVRAVSGFGFSLIATPLMTLVLETKSVVVLNIILATITNIIVLINTWRHIDFRRMLLISAGGIIGVPVGAYLLSRLDPTVIKLAIAVLVIPFSVLLMLGHSWHFRRDGAGCGVAGFLGGVLGASTSLGGPPVVLYLLNQGLVSRAFIGTICAFFMVINLASLGAYAYLHMVTTDILLKAALLLPPLLLGSYLGFKVLPHIKAPMFKKLASAVVTLTAVSIVFTIIVNR